MTAVMAGKELDAAATAISGFEDYVRSGDLIMVAVMEDKRLPEFPEVPTTLETPGLRPESRKLLELSNFLGGVGKMLMAPPGLPETKRVYLEKALLAALKEPAVLDMGKKRGLVPAPLPGEECKELITKVFEIVPKSERAKFKYLITQKYF